MSQIRRESPIQFGLNPKETATIDNWTVALEYDEEGSGPWIVDLSHKARWDLQDRNVGDFTPCDQPVPASPGQSVLSGDILINRMNGTQASIYHLGTAAELPNDSAYTNVTESTLFVALFGSNAFLIAEKLTNLDFMCPDKSAPFLLQGPFCHVPCQIVTLEKTAEGHGGFLMTCSRGYGDSMITAIRKAGAEFGLRPAGENRFTDWLATLTG
jgi:hypothetical protein